LDLPAVIIKKEIDAGRPANIQLAGDSVLGVGSDTSSEKNICTIPGITMCYYVLGQFLRRDADV
jgi:hypothetical protein